LWIWGPFSFAIVESSYFELILEQKVVFVVNPVEVAKLGPKHFFGILGDADFKLVHSIWFAGFRICLSFGGLLCDFLDFAARTIQVHGIEQLGRRNHSG